MGLTQEQKRQYEDAGFVVIPDLLSAEETEALRTRLREYTHGGRPADRLTIQIEPRIQRGELSVEHPGDGIRKIDGLAQGDRLFQGLALHTRIVSALCDILGENILMFRNSLLLKPPSVGSQKGWHQDSPYWAIEPMELCSCWFALDDATLENGCMVALPWGKERRALPHISVTDDFVIDPAFIDEARSVSLPMRAGSGLFFHSLLPHYTAPNRSQTWRRAIALSYMSAHSRYTGGGEEPEYEIVCGGAIAGCVRGKAMPADFAE